MTGARIDVVLHPALHRCLAHDLEQVDRRATERVVRVLRRLGIPGSPAVEVHDAEADEERAVRLLVNGIEAPFPPAFMARLWYAVAPDHLREAAFVPPSPTRRGVHDWLISLAQVLDMDEGRETLAALVERLVPGVVSYIPRICSARTTHSRFSAAGKYPRSQTRRRSCDSCSDSVCR